MQSRYAEVRQATAALVAGLGDADLTVQSAEFASPGKWHLAHTSWFFERFVLADALPGYQVFDAQFAYLFNSYYNAVGPRQPRPRRGLLTRPSLAQVIDYRTHVDLAMAKLLAAPPAAALAARIELGLQHEQQHQELLLTDLLHLFAQSPLRPAWRPAGPAPAPAPTTALGTPEPLEWAAFDGGIVKIGHGGPSFCFDHEQPRHDALLQPFELACRPVTNREWQAFVADGGYSDPAHWLSDGWDALQAQGWSAPLYWEASTDVPGGWQSMTLAGMQPLDPDAPVAHLSFFEADAYARRAGARLPTEFEWEHAAAGCAIDGNFVERGRFRPEAAGPGSGLRQLFGDVWEWTASPFIAYPGFRPSAGAIGEYNGKFMNGQYVLRGGSCASPRSHLRAAYRNFFQPDKRWQFSGLRLARDIG